MAQVDYLAMNGLHLGGGVGSTKVRDGGRARTHPSRGRCASPALHALWRVPCVRYAVVCHLP